MYFCSNTCLENFLMAFCSMVIEVTTRMPALLVGFLFDLSCIPISTKTLLVGHGYASNMQCHW